jgi:hypothetical protein
MAASLRLRGRPDFGGDLHRVPRGARRRSGVSSFLTASISSGSGFGVAGDREIGFDVASEILIVDLVQLDGGAK